VIYHYHPETGAYTGESYPAYDPLESQKQGRQVPLMPPNTTDVAPIQPVPAGYTIVFNPVKGVWGTVKLPEPSKPKITLTSNPKPSAIEGFISKVKCRVWTKDPELELEELDAGDTLRYLQAKVEAYYHETIAHVVEETPPASDGWYQRLIIEAGQVRTKGTVGVTLSTYANALGVSTHDAAVKLISNYGKQAKFMGMAMGTRTKLLVDLNKAFSNNITDQAKKAAMISVDLSVMLDVINKPI